MAGHSWLNTLAETVLVAKPNAVSGQNLHFDPPVYRLESGFQLGIRCEFSEALKYTHLKKAVLSEDTSSGALHHALVDASNRRSLPARRIRP